MSPSLTVKSSFSRKAICFFPMISIAVFGLLFSPFLASAWETQINKVHDGDTIEVYRRGRSVDVRFYGIDCPEKYQSYGLKAKRYVARMCEDLSCRACKFYADLGLINANNRESFPPLNSISFP